MDIYQMMIDNADKLKNTDVDCFLGFTQKSLRMELYIGFFAITSGNGFKKFLKNNKGNPHLKNLHLAMNKISNTLGNVRHNFLAHMHFDFDFDKIKMVSSSDMESLYSQLREAVIEISPKSLAFPEAPSHYVQHSLQAIIERAQPKNET